MMIFSLEPKYLNVLFCLVIIASVTNNICFMALKIVRVDELKNWQNGSFQISEVSLKNFRSYWSQVIEFEAELY